MTFAGFKLMFPIEQMSFWAAKYSFITKDDLAAEAGKNIREGNYTFGNLATIVRWKSERRAALLLDNTAAEVEEALTLSLQANEPRTAMAVLMGLRGVGTPMASAILASIAEHQYTVIDYRTLAALGVPAQDTTLDFYVRHYLPECKRLASSSGATLRTVDRALWSWSVDNEKGKTKVIP